MFSRDDWLPRNTPLWKGLVLATLASGTIALIEFTFAISVSLFIFPGTLSTYIGFGIGAIMLASVVPSLISAFLGTNPATICGARGASVPILAAMVAALAAAAEAEKIPMDVLFPTIVATVAISSIVTGLFLALIGQLKWGNLIRYIPYPVMGGFFAGMGYLFITGGLSVMAGESIGIRSLPRLVDPQILQFWLPGALFGLALFLAQKRSGHWLVFPGAFLLGLAAFYGWLFAAGMSIQDARSAGWLVGGLGGQSSFWPPLNLEQFSAVDWSLVGAQGGAILILFFINAVALLLDASGIELLSKRDLNLNRDLKTSGLGNVLCGLLGGTAGVHSVGNSAFTINLAGVHRLGVLLYAAFSALALFFGAQVVGWMPVPLLGGLLFFLGLDFVTDWIIFGLKRVPRVDYALVLVIFLAIAAVGVLQGVMLGFLMAVVIFAYNYSKVSVVKFALPGNLAETYIDRPPEHTEVLDRHGAAIQIYVLQGYLFFGSANRLIEEIQARLEDPDQIPVEYLLLDFRLVNEIDVSVAQSFDKLSLMSRRHGFHLVLTDTNPTVKGMLQRLDFFPTPEAERFHYFEEFSRGAGWCEDQILHEHGFEEEAPVSLSGFLRELFPDRSEAPDILNDKFEERILEQGDLVFSQGDSADAVFFLSHGRVDIMAESGSSSRRLRTLGPGTLFGEMAFYGNTSRSASARAKTRVVLGVLNQDAWSRLRENHPEIAEQFHVFVVNRLSDRLARTNVRLLRALS